MPRRISWPSSGLPQGYWAKVWSNNPLERVNVETQAADTSRWGLLEPCLGRGLITAVCADQHDEWLTSDRRNLPKFSMPQLAGTTSEIDSEASRATPMAWSSQHGGCCGPSETTQRDVVQNN